MFLIRRPDCRTLSLASRTDNMNALDRNHWLLRKRTLPYERRLKQISCISALIFFTVAFFAPVLYSLGWWVWNRGQVTVAGTDFKVPLNWAPLPFYVPTIRPGTSEIGLDKMGLTVIDGFFVTQTYASITINHDPFEKKPLSVWMEGELKLLEAMGVQGSVWDPGLDEKVACVAEGSFRSSCRFERGHLSVRSVNLSDPTVLYDMLRSARIPKQQ
jgi:hypothetical protein